MKRPRRLRVNLLSGSTAALCLLGVLFLLGGVAGCMMAGLLGAEDCSELIGVLDERTALLKQGVAPVSFLPVLWQVVRVPLLAFLLGLTALGIVGLPVLFLLRGYCLCYAIATLYRLSGTSGLAMGLCLFGTSALFWLPGLLGLGVVGLSGAYGLLRRISGNGRSALQFSTGRYWRQCALCGCGVLCAAVVEYFLVPILLQFII